MQPTFFRTVLLTGLLLISLAASAQHISDSPGFLCKISSGTSGINRAPTNMVISCFDYRIGDLAIVTAQYLQGSTSEEEVHYEQISDKELLQLREEKITQHRLNLIFLLTIVLTFIVVIILVNGYRENRKQRRLLEEKNDLLSEANLKLEKSENELRQMYNEQTKLFSIVAHDLRNPISAVSGFAELLEENYDELDQETRKEYIEQISLGAFRTLSLLENLLLWARSQMDLIKVKKANVPVKDLIHSSTSHMLSAVIKKNLKLHIDVLDDFELYVDPEMIKAVIRNLISNAIKFSYPGRDIIISSYIDDGTYCVSIKDHGTGIDPEVISTLGCKGSNPTMEGTAKEAGSGLGLLISKDYTEKNGGTIEIESEPGKGSVFTICFPVL